MGGPCFGVRTGRGWRVGARRRNRSANHGRLLPVGARPEPACHTTGDPPIQRRGERLHGGEGAGPRRDVYAPDLSPIDHFHDPGGHLLGRERHGPRGVGLREALGVDEARTDGRYDHTSRPELTIERLRERHDRVLGGRVDRSTGERVSTSERGHVDHVPTRFQQQRQEHLAARQDGEVVRLGDEADPLERQLREPSSAGNASVVHEDVAAVVLLLDVRPERLKILEPRHVGGVPRRFTARGAYLLGDPLQPVGAPGRQHHGRTRSSEGPGRRLADAAGRAGDDADLPADHGPENTDRDCPPSMTITDPVIHAAASETRNRATPATSPAVPQRPRGIWERIISWYEGSSRADEFISVSTNPGAIALTRTPCGAHSRASVWVKLTSAALAAA